MRRRIKIWRAAFSPPRFPALFAFTVLFFALSALGFAQFVGFVETREGAVFVDPILELLPVVDLTWLIFSVVYGSVLLGIWKLSASPKDLVFGFQVYGGMFLIRIAAMYTLPLDPPAGFLLLEDPFARLMFGAAVAPTRDLFFSGHTATMFVLFITAIGKPERWAFFVGMIAVGLGVLLHRAHYSVDVLAAPFFVYGVYRVARYLEPKIIIVEPGI